MLILAFDCSSPAGSVAVLESTKVVARQALDPAQRSARTLAPAIASAINAAGRVMREIRLLATTVGPGSFTGLRVGVTMVKTLAYALECDVIGLNTLDVIAAQAAIALPNASSSIHVILDAQRKELFASRYRPSQDPGIPPERIDGPAILSGEAWLKTLQPGDAVSGAGLSRWKNRLPPGITLVPQEFHEPDAVTIGRLALQEHQAGRRDDLWTLTPLYIRPSYADERRLGQTFGS